MVANEADMAYRRRVITIFEWLEPRDGDLILDGGCGRGSGNGGGHGAGGIGDGGSGSIGGSNQWRRYGFIWTTSFSAPRDGQAGSARDGPAGSAGKGRTLATGYRAPVSSATRLDRLSAALW